MSADEAYKTVQQIAAKFGISPKTVYRRCHQTVDPWPFSRTGGKGSAMRFSPADEAAIEQMQRAHTEAPQVSAITPKQLRRVGKALLASNPKRTGLAA